LWQIVGIELELLNTNQTNMNQKDCAPFIKLATKGFQAYMKHQKKNQAGGGGGGQTASRDAGGLMDLANKAMGMAGVDNKWKLSNIGGIGSKEDTALRKKAAEGEPEFAGAGSSVGIEVWRIEKFKRKIEKNSTPKIVKTFLSPLEPACYVPSCLHSFNLMWVYGICSREAGCARQQLVLVQRGRIHCFGDNAETRLVGIRMGPSLLAWEG
jgi:hypothetical protein